VLIFKFAMAIRNRWRSFI